jgi:peroxiredoxin Q/BCP
MKNILLLFSSIVTIASIARAEELRVGSPAPMFTASNQEGQSFDLKSRKGKWTVLYFYPKAETPGCTKQACAFRDNIKKITAEGADVYGISVDTVAAQKGFHKNHNLNFDLLADPDGKVVGLYGTKYTGVSMSKRWTFIINPELKIVDIQKDVDPVVDSEKMGQRLKELKAKSK